MAFGVWRSKFQGEISEGRLGGKRVILLKPLTYMNESGRAVGEAARFLKVPPEDVIIVHDELDLAPGKCRVKVGGGHAGPQRAAFGPRPYRSGLCPRAGWESAIRATRTWSRATSCTTSPRPTNAGFPS